MPSSFRDVNFVPDEVINQRKKETQIKYGNRYSIIIAVVVLVAGLSFFFYNSYTETQINDTKGQIENEESQIAELEEFGQTGHQLGVRLKAVKDIVETRVMHSRLIEDLFTQKPDGILIDNFQISDAGIINISARAPENHSVADFQRNLQAAESRYYSDVRIRSATLDNREGSVRFAFQINLNLEALYESLE